MKNHFWYSQLLADMCHEEGDELNKCTILVAGEAVEVEYTHASTEYTPNGGATWGDEVYLGEGDITYVGKKPRLDALYADDFDEDDYV